MTLTFDPVAYGRLLAEVTPMVIETEAEYHRALTRAEQITLASDYIPQ
jgi:hypothetical protein